MSRLQRIVLGVYCVSLVYCFVWTPWCVTNDSRYGTDRERLGYGWLWAGPRYPQLSTTIARPDTAGQPAAIADFSDIDQFVAEQSKREAWETASKYATPDTPLLIFRVIALSFLFGAAFLWTGIGKVSRVVNERK
jgi:hypothetical protein